MIHKLIIRSVWIVVFAVVVYAGFAIWSDYRKNVEILKEFPWQWLPIVLAAVLMNFLLRELKWDFYRRQAGVAAPRFSSFLIYFSGYSMAISPGRVGELIKPFMYKQYHGYKMSRTVPLVLCERVSDLLGMVTLSALCVLFFAADIRQESAPNIHPAVIYVFLGISIASVVGVVWLIRRQRLVLAIFQWFDDRQRFPKLIHKFREMYETTYPLLTARNLLITTAIATVSWFFECIALDMILHGVGAPQVSLGSAAFIFCIATVFGGLMFFLPGGIGGFEAATIAMLNLLGVAKAPATAATILIRFCTLFFSVVLGFMFLLFTSARHHRSIDWDRFTKVEDEVEHGIDITQAENDVDGSSVGNGDGAPRRDDSDNQG